MNPRHRTAATAVLDDLAVLIEPVKLHYLWRPRLGDVADEMVLQTQSTAGLIVS